MSVVHVNIDNFESVVKSSEKPVLLDFFANWCGPCRMISPIIEEIAAEHPEYVVGKINVDEESELAAQFGVVSIPMLVVVKDGEIAAKLVGARPKEQILSMFN
jgi:thioredoxin 1